jgi:cell division protease FtsH
VTFGKKEEEIFLGREIAQHRDYSEQTAQEIDREVRNIITQAEKKVEQLLSENMDKLHRLAEALLEREILDGEEIDLLLAGKELPRKVNSGKSGNNSGGTTEKPQISGDGKKVKVKSHGKSLVRKSKPPSKKTLVEDKKTDSTENQKNHK